MMDTSQTQASATGARQIAMLTRRPAQSHENCDDPCRGAACGLPAQARDGHLVDAGLGSCPGGVGAGWLMK